jgi:NCS2 family nucleobase:cation symporter-2
VGLNAAEEVALISGVLVAGGIVTLLQTLGAGVVGAKLPLLNSTTFKFLGPLIVAYKAGGFAFLYMGAIISGFITAALGFVVGKIQRVFTPFIIGAFLIITGTSLIPIALNNLVAVGKPQEGSANTLITAAVTLAIMVYLMMAKARPFRKLRSVAVLIGFVIGYVLAICLGMVDFSEIGDEPWFGLAVPYSLGFPSWPGVAVTLAFTVVFVACLVETSGDATAVSAILGRKITKRQLRGAVIADGLSGPISTIVGGLPMTTYGQNVGLVRVSRVGSRFVVAGAGLLLIIIGCLPKFTAVIAAMPPSVLGAGLAVTFGIIAIEGMKIAGPHLANQRISSVLILGLLPAIGLRVLPSDLLGRIPELVSPLTTDPMVAGLLIVLVLHLVLPGRTADSTREADRALN